MRSNSPARSPIAWLGLAAALALSLTSLFLSTRHGMGLGNDSRAFIGPALGYLHGDAVVSLHHPPLLGRLIWGVASVTGLDVVEAARYIQLIATVALVSGVWWQLCWALPEYPLVANAAALLTATCFPIVEHQGNVGSDQLGAAFAVWTLALLARHLRAEAGWRWLGACLVTAALAFLNRFAAFGLLLSVSIILWLHRGRPFGKDFFTALGAGVLMVTPCALFLAANAVSSGQATTREIVWNGIPWDRIRQSLETLGLWYLPNQLARWPMGLALLLAGAVLLWFGRGWARATPTARALIITLGGFGLANLMFLVTAISLFEFGLALDSRTLLPCVPISIALAALVVGIVSAGTKLRRAAAFLTFLSLLGMNTQRAASLAASYNVLGKGHLGVTAAQSALPDFVAAHHGAAFITNNPPNFFNLTRTGCVDLPAEYSILTNLRDANFDAEIVALRARLRTGPPSFLVVFETTDIETRAPAQCLMDGDRFERVFNDYFVSVYRHAP